MMIPDLSISLYRWITRAYPAAFREDYGEAVDQAFRDNVRDAFEERGYLGLALLWFHVIPDFLFSSGELLLSKAGDFLKWRFRLQWVVACSLGFGLSRCINLLIGRNFGASSVVLGTILGMVVRLLCVGGMQSLVLTGRCFRKKQWVLYGVAGAILGTLAVQALLLVTGPGLSYFFTLRSPLSRGLLQSLISNTLISAPMIILGACIGALQSSAIKNDAVTRYRWMRASAAGYFLSAAAGGFIVPYPMNAPIPVLEIVLNSVAAGAALGLLTCGPLEQILFSVELSPEERP